MKQLKVYLLIFLVLLLSVLLPAIAMAAETWEYYFPVTITDNTSTSRTNLPVLLNFGGQNLINSGYIVTGLDTAMKQGDITTTNETYMMATAQVPLVIDTLPAGGQQTYRLYTGYAPGQTAFPIIVGDGGTITTPEATNMRLCSAFTIDIKGYFNTTAGANKYILNKQNAFSIYIDPTTSGTVHATIGQNLNSLTQVIEGGSHDDIAATSTEYNVLMGGARENFWTATESDICQVMPTAGTISQLFVKLSANVAAGTATFTLMKNGIPQALSLVIIAGQSSSEDLTHSVSFVAGDTVSLKYVTSGASGTPNVAWSALWNSATPNESIMLLSGLCNIGDAIYAIPQGYDNSAVTNESRATAPMPTGGTFSKMYVKLSADPGDPGDPDGYKFMLRKAKGDTSLTVTVAADATTGNDTTNTAAFVAGDLVDLQISPENVPAVAPRAAVGLVFTPTIIGESVILGGSPSDQLDNAATKYLAVCGGGTSWNQNPVNAFQNTQSTIKSKLYAKLTTAPDFGGGVQSYTLTYIEAWAPTDLTVTIDELSTTGSDLTHTRTSVPGGMTCMQSVPALAPIPSYATWGLVSRPVGITITAAGVFLNNEQIITVAIEEG